VAFDHCNLSCAKHLTATRVIAGYIEAAKSGERSD